MPNSLQNIPKALALFLLNEWATKFHDLVDITCGTPLLCTFKPPAVVQISHFAKNHPSSFLRLGDFSFYPLFSAKGRQEEFKV